MPDILISFQIKVKASLIGQNLTTLVAKSDFKTCEPFIGLGPGYLELGYLSTRGGGGR